MRLFSRSPDLEAGTPRRPELHSRCSRSTAELLPTYPPPPSLPNPPDTSPIPNEEKDKSSSLFVNYRPSVSFGPDQEIDSEPVDKLEQLLEKYDPKGNNVPAATPMPAHRLMMRDIFLDNILYQSVKVHRHYYILQSDNEKYKPLCNPKRWDQIHDDLKRYRESIQDYEYWLNSPIQTKASEPISLPSLFATYGQTLATIECATYHTPATDASTHSVIQQLSQSLASHHTFWSTTSSANRTAKYRANSEKKRKRALWARILMATFGGLTLIVPMLIMVLDQRRVTTLVTTSAFTFAIGLILAFWMEDAQNKDILAATAAYAAVLVVFVGSGTVN